MASPDLPQERRLRKKSGDLAQLFYMWLDWDWASPQLGSSACHGRYAGYLPYAPSLDVPRGPAPQHGQRPLTTSPSACHGSGALSDFREDLREALCAFAKGSAFDPTVRPPSRAAAALLDEMRVLPATRTRSPHLALTLA